MQAIALIKKAEFTSASLHCWTV